MADETTANRGIFEEFIEAISGVIPLLDNIKISIAESTGRIPKASRQLHSVTEATESATVEILNVLDAMSQKITKVEAGVAEVKQSQHHQNEAARKLNEMIAETGIESLRTGWENFRKSTDQTESIAAIERFLGQIKQDSMNIAMALQVQDITSQQIAGATHMIESVRLELARILEHFNGDCTKNPGPLPPAGTKTEAPQHFDTDAQFSRSNARQETADAIVKQWNGRDHAAEL